MTIFKEKKAMVSRGTLVLVLILSMLAWPLVAGAEELVSGRYHDLGGNEVRVELTIGSPAPASIILIQNLPRGVKVIASSPELKKYSPSKGQAKWLFRKVVAGKKIVSVTLDRPVGKGEISGEIRCRDAAGKMVTVQLSK
jgi:hypothetical protein